MSMHQAHFPRPSAYGQGQLVVNLRKPTDAFGISPKITIDGCPAPAPWDRNIYPVVPGRHQVRAAVGYLWDYGAASQLLDIGPGQAVELHDSAPTMTLMSGRMGFEPQPHPGMIGFWLVMGAAGLIILTVLVVFIGATVSG